MIWNWGSFGRLNLTPSIYNTVATIPSGDLAVVNVNITNRNSSPVKVHLVISNTTPPPDYSGFLEYDLNIGANETVERTNITLEGLNYVLAYSTSANITVEVWGKAVLLTSFPNLNLSGHKGHDDLIADTLTLAYAAPLDKYSVMSVNFANRNNFPVKVSLANAHSTVPADYTVNDEDWMEYEYTLFPYEVLERTDIAQYTSATNSHEFISAKSDSNNVSFNVYGIIADYGTEW